jgi:ABC-type nitrate/sulfonate/bicarbonate transport system substrate-binding protein
MNRHVLPVGFIPLVDAAPLIVAQEMGFADEERLTLDLRRAASWSMLRDMLVFGQVDAAHMLSVVPVATALGLGGAMAGLEALMVLNLNGQVVAVSPALAGRMRAAGHGFDFTDARAAGQALLAAGQGLRIGVPFPFSMHAELIHYWLEGMAPQGLTIHTVPPPHMAKALAAGEIDAFCVGEPWGSDAVERAGAALLLPGSAIWSQAPEKVLATRTGWAEAEPELAGRLMRALWRTARWLGDPANRLTASGMLARSDYLDLEAEVIDRALSGLLITAARGAEQHVPQFLEYHAGAANFPWRSQAGWIGARLAGRFGLDRAASIAAAKATFRSDLYRQHLGPAGAELPAASEKLEGASVGPTPAASNRGKLVLQRNSFFDGRIFDPLPPG